MKISHLLYVISLSFILNCSLDAQQFPIYSQYMMSSFLLNPAVAGHEGYTAVNLTVREQWLGLKDAPSTYAFSAQTRLLKNSFISRQKSVRRRKRVMSRSGKVGLGANLFNDSNGAFTKTGASFTYSYHLTLRRSQISMGASIKTFQYFLDKNKLISDEDELIQNIASKAFITDADLGGYYSDRNIYAGISVQNLLESFFKLDNSTDEDGLQLIRQYLIMAGYRLDLIDFLFIEPSFLFKLSEQGVGQLDVSTKFYYRQDYWAGVSYRTGSGDRIVNDNLGGKGQSLIFMLGARVDKYHIGYAFDYTFSSISSKTIGSHEVMLAIKFGDSARRYRWLNRY